MLWYIFSRLSQVYHVISESQSRHGESPSMARRIRSNVLKLSWYPIIIVLCWIPSGVYDLREAFNSNESKYSTEADYANLLPVLKGFLTAVAFCLTTKVGGAPAEDPSPQKHKPSRMGDDSTEEDGPVDSMKEALLYQRYLGDESDDADRISTTSSQSLENADSNYRENSDMLRCSLPELPPRDSVESF
jgi:hypothetical protein